VSVRRVVKFIVVVPALRGNKKACDTVSVCHENGHSKLLVWWEFLEWGHWDFLPLNTPLELGWFRSSVVLLMRFVCQSPYPQRCLFLVPWHFNKFFYFYIVGNGFLMGMWGRAGGMKTP